MPKSKEPSTHGVYTRAKRKNVLYGTSWPLRALLVFTLLIPASLAAWFTWQQRVTILAEAASTAQRSVLALSEHAAKALDTHSLILSQVSSMTQGRSLDEIAADPKVKQFFTYVTSDLAQVAVVGMADANGRLWLDTAKAPHATSSVADRDYFLVHKNGTVKGMFISESFTGRSTNVRQFVISIARTSPSGAFDGVIYTAVPIDYFTRFWKQFAPVSGYLVPLVRNDGTILARYPALHNPERLPPNGPFMARIRNTRQGFYTAVSKVDGIERMNAYTQVWSYPLYISYSIETGAALQRWRNTIFPALVMAAIAAAALMALWLAVVRQSYQQRVATERWRTIAERLKSEVERREQAEEALHQSKKMEAIGQLAGGIAHDFNNLLASIVGNLEMMRLRMAQQRHADFARYIDAAMSVTDKATAMTQRLLAFSRRQALSPKPTDVNQRIAFMHELIERSVGPPIQVRTVLAEAACNTLCDPNQLESALLNLAINARDAMPDGGALTIATATASFKATAEADAMGAPPGDYVIVSVADTGSGMPADVVEKAFDPFFTTKPIGQGTGLGLSMVYGFVEQSGGRVRIESAVGAGTTVRLYLPRYYGALLQDHSESAPLHVPRLGKEATILLVDDEAPLRQLLTEKLGDLGYRVMSASDGAQALDIVKSPGPLDLLISDIGLPGNLNGKQMADAARALRPDLKVMFITGYEDRVAAEAKPEQADVMMKPFRLDDFARKVADMLKAETSIPTRTAAMPNRTCP